jgi:hypothetical protein
MYDDDYVDAHMQNIIYWGLSVFRKHPYLFACWCTVDVTNMPWALGLIDEDFCPYPGPYERHAALITSPILTLTELPACRAGFRATPWSDGLCLTFEHYSGMEVTFHQYHDGSGGVHLGVRDGCDGYPVEVTVPYAIVGEYLACTAVDPTRWHERPGRVRNPRPFDVLEAVASHYAQTGDSELGWQRAATDQWFATIKDELLQRIVATF